jgi:hypothetical protein
MSWKNVLRKESFASDVRDHFGTWNPQDDDNFGYEEFDYDSFGNKLYGKIDDFVQNILKSKNLELTSTSKYGKIHAKVGGIGLRIFWTPNNYDYLLGQVEIEEFEQEPVDYGHPDGPEDEDKLDEEGNPIPSFEENEWEYDQMDFGEFSHPRSPLLDNVEEWFAAEPYERHNYDKPFQVLNLLEHLKTM